MYFSVSVMPATLQVAPLQLIPALFAVTEGTPVVSDTAMSTVVREQTGMRCAVSPSEFGSTMFPVMKFTTFALLVLL
jgi:hypothetical protein